MAPDPAASTLGSPLALLQGTAGTAPAGAAQPAPSGVPDAGAHATAQRQLAAASAQEQDRRSDQARDERRRSRSRFRGLGAKAAAAIAGETFPEMVQRPVWTPPALRPGERKAGYRGDNVMVVRREGEKGAALAVSPLPLVTHEAGGERVPVDVTLERTDDGFRARNPLVHANLPALLQDGVRFPEHDVSLTPVAGGSGTARQVEDKIFYDNVEADTDVILSAVPTGVAIFYQLRSPSAPEAIGIKGSAAGKVSFAVTPDGEADLLVDGRHVAGIAAPAAFDAQGKPVAVHYEAAGDTLDVRVAHRDADVAYPVMVDPIVSYALDEPQLDNTYGSSWQFATPWPGAFNGGYCPVSQAQCNNIGDLWLQTKANQYYYSGTYGWWTQKVPTGPGGTTFAFRAEWQHLRHSTPTSACISAGIANPAGGWEAGSANDPVTGTSTTGAWTNCPGLSDSWPTTCARASCAWEGTNGDFPALQQWMSGNGTRTIVDTAWVYQPVTYWRDHDTPTIAETYWSDGATSTGWTHFDTLYGQYTARQNGLGLASVEANSTDAEVADPQGGDRGCYGDWASRCPYVWTQNYTVYPDEGISTVRLEATDVLGRTAAPVTRQVKFDATAPAMYVTGGLRALADQAASDDSYDLTVDAYDSISGLTTSGVRTVELLVDGVRAVIASDPCAANANCDMLGKKLTFKPYNYAPGAHILSVIATDGAGNQKRDDWSVTVAAGAVTSPKEGAKAARRLTLKAQAKKSGQTSVTWSYSTAGRSGPWTAIPAAALTDARNTPLTDPAIPLSSGASTPVGLDMSALPNVTTTPGTALYVRGTFAGGDAGATQVVRVDVDLKGMDARSATADVGPGTVNLLTGNFSMSETDVTIDGALADLTVARTYNSRAGNEGWSGPFGPGWTASMPVLGAGSQYARIEEKPGTIYVIVVLSDGTELPFTQSASGLTPEPGGEDLKLTHPPLASGVAGSQDPAVYELRDLDGNVTRFARSGTTSTFLPDTTTQPASESKTTYVMQTIAGQQRVKTEYAPMPGGVNCAATFDSSCRALEFRYATTTTANGEGDAGDSSSGWGDYYGQLSAIDLKAYDPASGTVTTETVARYQYDSSARLRAAWDPRVSPALKTTYNYDIYGNGLITQVTPPGLRPWSLTYTKLASDAGYGRLTQASRDSLTTPATAKWTIAYNIPLGGTGAPMQMRAADLDLWGQKDIPTDATAIFPPDQVPAASPPTDFARATVYYLDRDGYSVNALDPGGYVTTSERDAYGNVTRELTAGNRARALASGSPAQRAAELDTQRTYTADGLDMTDELGPLHRVRLADGTETDARQHTRIAYDEAGHGQTAANTDGPWHLPTTTTVGAMRPGSADADVRVTKTDYDFKFRAVTKTVADAAGSAPLTTVNVLDPQTGQVMERRMPRSPGGGDAGATKLTYYTRGSHSTATVCGNKPQWHNLLCKVGPAVQPVKPNTPAYGKIGDAGVRTHVETEAVGQVEAFPSSVTTAGSVNRLSIYIDATNTASQVQVGLYTSWDEQPTTLIRSCTIANPVAGAWNRCIVPDYAITMDDRLFTAVLQPQGSSGTLKFRDAGVAQAYRGTVGASTMPQSFGSATQRQGGGFASIMADYLDTVSRPDVPTSVVTYNKLLQVNHVTETSEDVTRDTSLGFDAAGRMASKDITSSEGVATPRVDVAYGSTTGLVSTTTTTSGKTVSRGYDTLGRLSSYTDSNGTTATTTYDLVGRVATSSDGKAAQTYAYEPSGLLKTLTDADAGTFSVDYDADGRVVKRTYPNGMAADLTYDESGSPVGIKYTKTTNCATNCVWLQSTVLENVHGQWMRQDGTLSAQKYQYDAFGRLARIDDTPAGQGCTVRTYGYDADSNRTESRVKAPASGGACDPSAAGVARTHTYDTADRITDTGYTYDKFGRIGTVPAADAGGSDLTATYYVDDLAQSISQGGHTTTYVLDPLRRVERRDIDGAAEIQHYDSDSDNPSWIATGATWSRYVAGIDGELIAIQAGGTTTLQLTNLHGDVIGTASTSQTATAPTATFEADEFGVPRQAVPSGRRYGWLGGKQRSTETATGTIRMGARLYVPQVGRFLQVDPISGGSANAYDYASQDPVNAFDVAGTNATDRVGLPLPNGGVSGIQGPSLGQNGPSYPTPKAGSRGGPGAGKPFSEKTKARAKAENREKRCVYCGRKTSPARGPRQTNIDHVVPKSKGGNNTIDNAQVTCRRCNQSKGNRAAPKGVAGYSKGRGRPD